MGLPTSPAKTPDSFGSKGSDEVAIRRPSVPSPTRGLASPTRRPSRSLTQHDLAATSTEGRRPSLRRDSGAGIFPPGRRPSFATIGNRVTSLLKAKNAFSGLKNLRRKSKDQANIHVELEPGCFEIKELPKEPRFASTLSAEAQYAMFKGYEDVVYRNLCNQFPEQVHLLRRNRTPVTGIVVKVTEQKDSSSDWTESPRKSEHNYIEQVMRVNKPRASISTQDSLTSSTPEINARTPPSNTPSPITYSITRLQGDQPDATQAPTSDSSNRSKPTEFPRIQQKQKLVMTYRYQSAMDVLDILREQQGMHRLSPRVSTVRPIEPVREYNTWSHVWSREFEPNQNTELGSRH